MDIRQTKIPGCFIIVPNMIRDERGFFVKTFHLDLFAEKGLETRFVEEYYSYSRRGVLRGLHFQSPPRDHVKLVYCVVGEVIDAVVDLRAGSPTFGRFETFRLSAEQANMLYVPSGLAHGFYVTSEHGIMLYNVTTVYSPEHDSGIRWNSAGIPWPDAHPVVSKRDGQFVSLTEFKSPFVFRGGVTSV